MKVRLEVLKSQQKMPWNTMILEPPGEYIIGRDPRNHIPIPDIYASRRHARIFHKNGEWYIEDLDSKNGTLLNDTQLKGRGAVKLSDGMEIIIGLTVIRISIVEDDSGEG